MHLLVTPVLNLSLASSSLWKDDRGRKEGARNGASGRVRAGWLTLGLRALPAAAGTELTALGPNAGHNHYCRFIYLTVLTSPSSSPSYGGRLRAIITSYCARSAA